VFLQNVELKSMLVALTISDYVFIQGPIFVGTIKAE